MKKQLYQNILKHWNLLSIIILLIGAMWILITKDNSNSTGETSMAFPKAGFLSPDFELETLDGQSIKLSQLRGSAIVVNFWASWCQPCRIEMPAIQKAVNAHKADGVIVLAVNMTNQDNVERVRDFIQELNLTFNILLDQKGEAGAAFHVTALPTTFFIRPDGIIEEVVIGGPMAEALLLTRIEKLLNPR